LRPTVSDIDVSQDFDGTYLSPRLWVSKMDVTQAEIKAVSNELVLKGSIEELFGSPVFRRNLIIMIIIWSFCAFATYLVPPYVVNLENNIYLMSLALGIAEFIAAVLCLCVINGKDLKQI
jgi:hypothetical protein